MDWTEINRAASIVRRTPIASDRRAPVQRRQVDRARSSARLIMVGAVLATVGVTLFLGALVALVELTAGMHRPSLIIPALFIAAVGAASLAYGVHSITAGIVGGRRR